VLAYGAILPVLAALVLSLVTLFVLYFMLKESKPASNEIYISDKGTIRKVFAQECKECYETADTTKSGFKKVFKLKHISFLLVLYFLIFLGFNIYYASFPPHAAKDLKWSVTQVNLKLCVRSELRKPL
jgi:Na+/melibiose symporter-like transporter